jgi:hypothetical protein
MFKKKKKCPECGKLVESDWNFCPACGVELTEEEEEYEEERFAPFSMFEDIEKEFERIDKMFSFKPFKFPKLQPHVRGGGISIVVQTGTGMKPRVEVKTSGEYKKIEPEIKRKLGIKPPVEEVGEEVEEEERIEKKRRVPKITEEAETKVETVGNKQIFSIKLPDVKSEKDIEIKKLEQSIEVKAFAGDKAYFTLIPMHGNASIVGKEFKDGILKIEIERS